MQVQFNNSSNKSSSSNSLGEGNFEDMMKTRKKNLPEIEQTIQNALKNYSGENICIIIQHEDEDGMPDHSQMVLAGVSRLETQVAMARTLSKASDQALQVLMEMSKGDMKAMLAIAAALAQIVSTEKGKK